MTATRNKMRSVGRWAVCSTGVKLERQTGQAFRPTVETQLKRLLAQFFD